MSNKQTNMGVQLMPLLLIVSSLGFYMLTAFVLSGVCFLVAMVMWIALFGESLK